MSSPDEAIEAAVDGERQLLDPDVRRSADRLVALVHPDFVELGASGRRWDRDSIIESLTTSPEAPEAQIVDMVPVLVAKGVVHLRYVAATSQRRSHRSSIWLHDESGWRIWFHQGTRITQTAAPTP